MPAGLAWFLLAAADIRLTGGPLRPTMMVAARPGPGSPA